MTDFVASLLTIGFLAQIVRISVPYVLAALGGTLTEKSGVIDLALEGKLLVGAFAAAVAMHETGSLAASLLAAAAAGTALAAVQGLWTIRLGADQVVTGIALNLAAAGLTRYLLSVAYDQSSNSPPIPGALPPVWQSPLTWIAAALAGATIFLFWRARAGLRIRAAGEHPEAVAAAAISVPRTRWLAVLVGGALAGFGGAQISLAADGFVADAANGRGYVALAVVIMSAWRPGRAALLCLGFSLAEALQIRLQREGLGLPPELVRLLPYVLALALLVAIRRDDAAPAALGHPHDARRTR